jgi:thioredoxin reductase (NADPH)
MGRAFSQAQKFGVEVAIPDEAIALECGNQPCRVKLATGEQIQGRSIVIATGARYRRLSVDGLERYEGASVHYWASPLEADLCAGEAVALVGGGNSAGQATVFVASRARQVTVVARRPLEETMSAYLIERIRSLPNVDVVIGCEIAALEGDDGKLSAVTWRDRRSGTETRRQIGYLFSFIGAEPNTDWLSPSGLRLDERGFVLTGEDLDDDRLPLETSRHGVFAVGDVRSCSVKRVAAAVGDGAQAVAGIHKYLRERDASAGTIAAPQVAAAAAAAN